MLGKGNFAVVKLATNSITKSKVSSQSDRQPLSFPQTNERTILCIHERVNCDDCESEIEKEKCVCLLYVILIPSILT